MTRETREFNGMRDTFKKTRSISGIRGLYRGLGPSVTGQVLFKGMYFSIFNAATTILWGENDTSNKFDVFCVA